MHHDCCSSLQHSSWVAIACFTLPITTVHLITFLQYISLPNICNIRIQVSKSKLWSSAACFFNVIFKIRSRTYFWPEKDLAMPLKIYHPLTRRTNIHVELLTILSLAICILDKYIDNEIHKHIIYSHNIKDSDYLREHKFLAGSVFSELNNGWR